MTQTPQSTPPTAADAPTDAPPALVPRPRTLRTRPGEWWPLGPGAGVRAPDEVAELVRELLPVRGSGPGIELTLADDPELGAEGYRLTVDERGVRGTAGTLTGLRWAVQTLRQLLRDGRLPLVEIVDRPRYGWRGSLLDVARHAHPLPFLYRYVDLLALHKLNTLHLHLTDDQGWRFEVRRYPKLTEVGGFRTGSVIGHHRDGRTDEVPHGGSYTQRELRDLVAYASRRGVRIMPEIDAPGHMQAAIAAYPWLGNRPDRRLPVRVAWGISPHVLNARERTVEFVRDVLDELVDVFPFEYVHIGGDEVPTEEWLASPEARERAAAERLAGPERLLGWWAGRLAAHLAGHGRRAAVWDELLEQGVPAGAAVFAWRSDDRVALAERAGHDLVAVPQQHTYLDYAETEAPDEPLAIGAGLPLEKVYAYRPPATALGVQGQLWSEYLPTPAAVEWRAFPRLAAIAELGWSAEADLGLADFQRRLRGHLPLLDGLGVGYRPLD
ncbi:beta-N-acetylhexosaminidase [Streptomyces sp. DSM 44915]|uniref:beta-N-acetylhexosaminidase n=1 Tax=Streptomyces chisholmiae TaxID=3075540 RepID=A0ABU2JPU4_9ACTN|nr:beta-N-acetylhexosaminidase [Streptomyces sp. DSM 44915]MDT0266539.1 beta-N-acetylhexosaminidase [Streptomyces sp. DSM 44915]